MEAYDRHHLYWPRRDYATALEKKFRGLPCHIMRITVAQHRQIHANQRAACKPPRKYMEEILQLHRDGNCLACGENQEPEEIDTEQDWDAPVRVPTRMNHYCFDCGEFTSIDMVTKLCDACYANWPNGPDHG